jgi:hypothetical protein
MVGRGVEVGRGVLVGAGPGVVVGVTVEMGRGREMGNAWQAVRRQASHSQTNFLVRGIQTL